MAAPMDDWRASDKRRAVISKLEEAIKSLQGPAPNNLQNPVEVEKTIFEKAKSSEEYSTYIRNVVLMLARQKNMQNQQAGQMTHQQPMGGAGRGMVAPGMHPGGGAGVAGAGGGAGGGAMMPATMNPQGMGMNPMAPGNYPYQAGMGPGQGQMGMGMQARPAAPPQYNTMYQQPGQMTGMVQSRFVGGQPGYQGMPSGAGYPPQQSMGMMQPGSYPGAGGRYPGAGQMMMSGGGGPGMAMRMPIMRTPMPAGRAMPPGAGGTMTMINSNPMSGPSHMANPAAQGYIMDSGVQPVRAVPNPSFSAARPPGAPQMSQGGVPSPYNAMLSSPSQQQQQQQNIPQAQGGPPPSSMPSAVAGPASSQAPPPSSAASSDQQPGASAGGAAGTSGGSGPSGQIGNPPTPHPGRDMPVPSPAPPTPLLPASPATSGIGSPAQQPLMTPEENEAYLRKLNELQRYTPLLNKWIARLSHDSKRSDQFMKLKSLYNLLNNEQRRVPLATLIKCEAALMKMFDQHATKDGQEQPVSGGQSQPLTSSVVAPPTSSASSSSPPVVASSTSSINASPSVTTTSSSSLPPPAEPVVPPTKLTDPSKSKSLMDFKMIPSPPPTCGNLLETIRAKPLPPERIPPAKRLCNRVSPTIPPSLLRELAVLDHFKIKLLPKENNFDKSTTLSCSLEDSGLPAVPALTVTIPPNYPSVSPICNLSEYHNNGLPFLKSVGKLLSEKLMRSHWTYSLSLLLTSWEDCVLRAMARELTSLEE